MLKVLFDKKESRFQRRVAFDKDIRKSTFSGSFVIFVVRHSRFYAFAGEVLKNSFPQNTQSKIKVKRNLIYFRLLTKRLFEKQNHKV